MTIKELTSQNIQLGLQLESLKRENERLKDENERLKREKRSYEFQFRQSKIN